MDPKQKQFFETYISNSLDFFDHDAKEVKNISGSNNTVLWYNNIGVNHEGGRRLIFNEKPLRTKRIKVWASDIFWKFSPFPAAVITSPNGMGIKANIGNFKFPDLPALCIVLYQASETCRAISASNAYEGVEIKLNDQYDIFITINDKMGHYHKNSGAFDINIEIL